MSLLGFPYKVLTLVVQLFFRILDFIEEILTYYKLPSNGNATSDDVSCGDTQAQVLNKATPKNINILVDIALSGKSEVLSVSAKNIPDKQNPSLRQKMLHCLALVGLLMTGTLKAAIINYFPAFRPSERQTRAHNSKIVTASSLETLLETSSLSLNGQKISIFSQPKDFCQVNGLKLNLEVRFTSRNSLFGIFQCLWPLADEKAYGSSNGVINLPTIQDLQLEENEKARSQNEKYDADKKKESDGNPTENRPEENADSQKDKKVKEKESVECFSVNDKREDYTAVTAGNDPDEEIESEEYSQEEIEIEDHSEEEDYDIKADSQDVDKNNRDEGKQCEEYSLEKKEVEDHSEEENYDLEENDTDEGEGKECELRPEMTEENYNFEEEEFKLESKLVYSDSEGNDQQHDTSEEKADSEIESIYSDEVHYDPEENEQQQDTNEEKAVSDNETIDSISSGEYSPEKDETEDYSEGKELELEDETVDKICGSPSSKTGPEEPDQQQNNIEEKVDPQNENNDTDGKITSEESSDEEDEADEYTDEDEFEVGNEDIETNRGQPSLRKILARKSMEGHYYYGSQSGASSPFSLNQSEPSVPNTPASLKSESDSSDCDEAIYKSVDSL